MALTKYNARTPAGNIDLYNQLREIDLSIGSIILLLALLEGKQVQIGPADSAGVGFRALRIPN
jgi:hypothetical protein